MQIRFKAVPSAFEQHLPWLTAGLMQVEGREHLPRPDEPAVYVANHQSFMVSTHP